MALMCPTNLFLHKFPTQLPIPKQVHFAFADVWMNRSEQLGNLFLDKLVEPTICPSSDELRQPCGKPASVSDAVFARGASPRQECVHLESLQFLTSL